VKTHIDNNFISFFSYWILNSGVTDHICSSLTYFTSNHQINLICAKLPNRNQVIVNYFESVFINQNQHDLSCVIIENDWFS